MDSPPIQYVTREEYEQMNQTLGDLAKTENPAKLMPRRGLDRARVAEAFQEAFEMIGGVNTFAMWAAENQTDFYKLYAKLLPNNMSVELPKEMTIKHVLPRSRLDEEYEDARLVEQTVSTDREREGKTDP